ncbi:MAG: tetratricopeptide repeat protein [Bacteroidales bacterium]|nr:tetratricopeptide repeat protein [Bacteroidales bacterium]
MEMYYSDLEECRRLAEQGDPYAQLELAEAYHEGKLIEKNIEAAIEWYEKSAEGGENFAHIELGRIYEFGDGVEQDYMKAIEHYEKAAYTSPLFHEPLYRLALFYLNGYGYEQNYEYAAQMFEVLSNADDDIVPEAKYQYGRCLENGIGVDKDLDQALYWYERAAKEGVEEAKMACERLKKQMI